MDTAIDPIALHHLFTLHAVVPAPRTILTGIRKLAPAHWLRLDADGTTTERSYWSLARIRPDRVPSAGDWVAAIGAALRQAVRRRSEVADVPVGVLLSGGLDSSLLVALLAELGSADLRTFSVGFEDTPEEAGSEFEYSDPVVARYGTRHHKFQVPNAQVLRRLPEAVDAMTEPMFGQDAVAFYLLAEQVSREIKVVQSGQGADEVFGGYFWYPRMAGRDRRRPPGALPPSTISTAITPSILRLVGPAFAGPDHTAPPRRRAAGPAGCRRAAGRRPAPGCRPP